jgi:hypothetical protein
MWHLFSRVSPDVWRWDAAGHDPLPRVLGPKALAAGNLVTDRVDLRGGLLLEQRLARHRALGAGRAIRLLFDDLRPRLDSAAAANVTEA